MSEETHHNHLMVIGRKIFDDEDTVMDFHHMTTDQAIEAFQQYHAEEEGYQTYDDMLDAEGEEGGTVFINQVLVSDSMIKTAII